MGYLILWCLIAHSFRADRAAGDGEAALTRSVDVEIVVSRLSLVFAVDTALISHLKNRAANAD